jgi:hypothetical protein
VEWYFFSGYTLERSDPGMIFERLDAVGRLLRLEVRPWAIPAATSMVDWAILFSNPVSTLVDS